MAIDRESMIATAVKAAEALGWAVEYEDHGQTVYVELTGSDGFQVIIEKPLGQLKAAIKAAGAPLVAEVTEEYDVVVVEEAAPLDLPVEVDAETAEIMRLLAEDEAKAALAETAEYAEAAAPELSQAVKDAEALQTMINEMQETEGDYPLPAVEVVLSEATIQTLKEAPMSTDSTNGLHEDPLAEHLPETYDTSLTLDEIKSTVAHGLDDQDRGAIPNARHIVTQVTRSFYVAPEGYDYAVARKGNEARRFGRAVSGQCKIKMEAEGWQFSWVPLDKDVVVTANGKVSLKDSPVAHTRYGRDGRLYADDGYAFQMTSKADPAKSVRYASISLPIWSPVVWDRAVVRA